MLLFKMYNDVRRNMNKNNHTSFVRFQSSFSTKGFFFHIFVDSMSLFILLHLHRLLGRLWNPVASCIHGNGPTLSALTRPGHQTHSSSPTLSAAATTALSHLVAASGQCWDVFLPGRVLPLCQEAFVGNLTSYCWCIEESQNRYDCYEQI